MLGARQWRKLLLFITFVIFYLTARFLYSPTQEQRTVRYWSKNPHDVHSRPFGDKALSRRYTGVPPYARPKLDWPSVHYRNNATNSTANDPVSGNNTHSNSTEPIGPNPGDTGPASSLDCRGDYTTMSFLLRLICDSAMQHYALLMTYVAIGAVALGIVALFAIYLSICLCGDVHCACEQDEVEKTMRRGRMMTGGGPLEELLIGIEEREGLENTDGATTKNIPKIKRKRPKSSSHPRWVQKELNARKANAASIGELEKATSSLNRTREASETRDNLLAQERNPLMPTVSELVQQASPRVVSTGHDARPGRKFSNKRTPWRIAGWGFAT